MNILCKISSNLTKEQFVLSKLFSKRFILAELEHLKGIEGRYSAIFDAPREYSTTIGRKPKIPVPEKYFITTPIYYLNAGNFLNLALIKLLKAMLICILT